ncbi:PEGA domain-containing protein [Myxococcaceae bacterium GXIMD 01537]
MNPRPKHVWRPLALGAALLGVAGCGSSTTVYSQPSGATVYIDGQRAGTTPYTYSDVKMLGARTRVQLVMEGYAVFDDELCRDERWEVLPLAGSAVLPFVPWAWTRGYYPEREYVLTPL